MRFLDLSTEYSVQYSQYFTPNKGSERVLLTPYGSSGLLAKIFWVGRGGQWGLGSGLVKLVHYFDTFQSAYLLVTCDMLFILDRLISVYRVATCIKVEQVKTPEAECVCRICLGGVQPEKGRATK
jgi:hypothetical protein